MRNEIVNLYPNHRQVVRFSVRDENCMCFPPGCVVCVGVSQQLVKHKSLCPIRGKVAHFRTSGEPPDFLWPVYYVISYLVGSS